MYRGTVSHINCLSAVNDSVRVGVAFLFTLVCILFDCLCGSKTYLCSLGCGRWGLGCSSSRCLSCDWSSFRASRSPLASTALSWHGNVIGISLESKVLERIAVPHRLLGVILGKLETLVVLASIVLYNTLTDLGDMKKTVEEIRGPVEICGTVGDVITEAAHALERLAGLVRQRADDSLSCGVLSTPVTGPAYQSQ